MPGLIQAMLDGGFSLEQAAATKRSLTDDLREDMLLVIGQKALDHFAMVSDAALQRAGGAIAFQVRVITRTKGDHAIAEHLVDVLATNETEAREVACQMAACRDTSPIDAEVITDSTLTAF